MAELTDEQKKSIIDFQTMQQQLQMVAMQRQQMAVQLAEAKRASEEVKKSDGGLYRFAGTVLVPKKKDDLDKELSNEIDSLQVKQELIQKQEEKLREKMQALAKKLESVK